MGKRSLISMPPAADGIWLDAESRSCWSDLLSSSSLSSSCCNAAASPTGNVCPMPSTSSRFSGMSLVRTQLPKAIASSSATESPSIVDGRRNA